MPPSRKPALPLTTILEWADEHHARSGGHPDAWSGPVAGQPAESWYNIDRALRLGYRGLPSKDTLAALLHRQRGHRDKHHQPPLSEDRIFAWAQDHRRRTGHWPQRGSGPVEGAPGEEWVRIDAALRHGRRGLPGGITLAALLRRRERVADARGKLTREYVSPILQPGEVVTCLLRGAVQVVGMSEAPIPWPVGKMGTHRSLVLCGELAEAIRRVS
jgi:hypothetical protein